MSTRKGLDTKKVIDVLEFVPADQVESAALAAGVEPAVVDAVVEEYEDAQLRALKTGLFVTAMIALAALAVTKHLPAEVPGKTVEDLALEGST